MHFTRALVTSIGIYLATFVLGGLLSIALGIEMSDDPASVPPAMWVISACVAVILMIGGSWWYFKSSAVTPSWKNGLFLGLIAVVTGGVLDAFMLLIAGLQEQLVDALLSYYTQPIFLFTLLLVILIPTIFGWWKQSKKV